MPVFETPQPISATIELGVGHVVIAASQRTDTLVDVRPSDPSDASDVLVAEETRVEYADGQLRVIAPRIRAMDFSRKRRSIEVSIELPTGSRVDAATQLGDVRTTGLLGDCRVKTGAGDVLLGDTGPLRVDTGMGEIAVRNIAGDAEIKTGSGRVRVDAVQGAITVKNSNGDTTVGSATGEARLRSANGEITVGQASSGVDAKTSNGAIRVGEAVRGSVVLKTAAGGLDIGVAEGTAAWLDLHTSFGRLRNTLSEAGPEPGAADQTAEIHARTSFGDITVRRAERQLP